MPSLYNVRGREALLHASTSPRLEISSGRRSLMVAKCRGDGRKPARHGARVVVVMLARPSRRHHQHRSSYCLRLGKAFCHQGRLLGETGIRKPPDALLPGSQPGPKPDLLSGRCGRVLAARQDTPRFASALRSCATRARENPFRRGLVKANALQTSYEPH